MQLLRRRDLAASVAWLVSVTQSQFFRFETNCRDKQRVDWDFVLTLAWRAVEARQTDYRALLPPSSDGFTPSATRLADGSSTLTAKRYSNSARLV
jgi:hypothetical protein